MSTRPNCLCFAGLNTPWPGFDVLSHRPDGNRRCIEIKGRARLGNIYIRPKTNGRRRRTGGDIGFTRYLIARPPHRAWWRCKTRSPRLVQKAAGFELSAADILAAGEQLA